MKHSHAKVIVIEDDPVWAQLISEIMIDMGLEPHVVHNLFDAQILIKNVSHSLAIVDLSLSKTDHNNSEGLLVLKALRTLDPSCRSILLTGFATVELAVETIKEYGAFSFLRKENFNRIQFQEIVNKALANKLPNYVFETNNNDFVNQMNIPISISQPLENTKFNILVIDDDAGWRSILEEILTDNNFHVRTCSGFGEAVSCLKHEDFSLAIIDLFLTNQADIFWEKTSTLTDLEGYELLKTTQYMEIPTIIVSGVSSIESVKQAYTNDIVFAFLEKQSFTRNSFIQIVNDALKNSHKEDELAELTDREREVYSFLLQGMTNKEISTKLFISTNTVKRHLKSVFSKLNVHTRSAAVAKNQSGN